MGRLLDKRIYGIAGLVGDVVQRVAGDFAEIPWPGLVVHARAESFEGAWAYVGDFELSGAEHAVQQLPTAQAVVRGALAGDFPRVEDFVDLVGDGVTVADVFEIRRIEISSHDASPLPVFFGS